MKRLVLVCLFSLENCAHQQKKARSNVHFLIPKSKHIEWNGGNSDAKSESREEKSANVYLITYTSREYNSFGLELIFFSRCCSRFDLQRHNRLCRVLKVSCKYVLTEERTKKRIRQARSRRENEDSRPEKKSPRGFKFIMT